MFEMIKLPRNGGLESRFLRNKAMCDDYQGKWEVRKTSEEVDIS